VHASGSRQNLALWKPCATCFRSGQFLDRRDPHQVLHSVGEFRIERDERVSLELGQGDVLGVKRVWPPELLAPTACELVDGLLTVSGGYAGA
jgi:hypothetical protein